MEANIFEIEPEMIRELNILNASWIQFYCFEFSVYFKFSNSYNFFGQKLGQMFKMEMENICSMELNKVYHKLIIHYNGSGSKFSQKKYQKRNISQKI